MVPPLQDEQILTAIKKTLTSLSRYHSNIKNDTPLNFHYIRVTKKDELEQLYINFEIEVDYSQDIPIIFTKTGIAPSFGAVTIKEVFTSPSKAQNIFRPVNFINSESSLPFL